MDGSELRALRQRAQLSGKELAAQLGLSAETISRYENGRSIPKVVELAARLLLERQNNGPA